MGLFFATPVGAGTGTVQIAGLTDTNIRGMGFDKNDNHLIALNNDGASAELISIDLAAPENSSLIGGAGVLDAAVGPAGVGGDSGRRVLDGKRDRPKSRKARPSRVPGSVPYLSRAGDQ